ncbi:cytochrome P450 [Roridomyces roridus]|uniref:Cytochrome P450 n=1 Tax=Roridomyces roridus TaxID=1738132 RepID=A0AAD7C778_9AGAR|nr:cytochrome P450 [Roridomyces roridus]
MDALSTPQVQLAVPALALAVLGGIYLFRSPSSSNAAGRPLPPGPPGLPLIGNLLQVPGTHLATYFKHVCQEYGGLASLNLAGFPIVLIGDMKAAKEVLEKRSAKFSSRPSIPYVRGHVDPSEIYWGVREQGPSHFIARKLTVGLMSAVRAGETDALQWHETLISMTHLLSGGGKDWAKHLDRTSASMVLTVAFGLHCPTGEEEEFKEVMDCLAMFINLCTPSASIINVLPFLDWIPGPMPWRTRAREYRRREDALYDRLIKNAVEGSGSGMNTWSAVFAREDKPEGDQRRLMNQFTGAAIETTALSMHVFVLAAILYPHWIARAQKEIDAVVGPDRLPTFKDRPSLPFVEALVRETLRWRPAARFGVPHQSTEDDIVEYDGKEYFIQKGSIVFAVSWAIDHDKERFANADAFIPERYLDDKGELKSGYETSAFGFGRRVCPGAPFAERALWIGIAMMLWAFDIRKSDEVDPKTGKVFEYGDGDDAFSGEFSNAPHHFPAVFEARSAHHAEVIRQEWADCEKDLNVLLPQRKER